MKTAIAVLLLIYIVARTTARTPSNFHTTASLSRTRRQANNEDTERCSAITARAACTSSYAQNFINDLSKCGDRAGIVNFTEQSCRRNNNGQYCGEISFSYIFGNCSGGSDPCSAGCSKVLMNAGCCLNGGSYDRFFTACGLSVPSQCEKSGLQIPTITDDNSCSSDDGFARQVLLTTCDNAGPILDALARDGNCPDLERQTRALCASRNNQYCYIELNITGSSENSAGVRSLAAAAANCPFTSNCSSTCNSSLTALVNTVGCCFQSVNMTAYNPSFDTSVIFDRRLWNTCNVPLVSPCGAPPMYALYISIIVIMAGVTLLLQI